MSRWQPVSHNARQTNTRESTVRSIVIALCLLLGLGPAVAAERLPAAAFSSALELREPQLSPDGQRLAALVRHEGQQLLVLRALAGPAGDYRAVFRSQDPELSLNSLRWLDDARLLLGVRDGQPMRRSDVSQDALLVVEADSGSVLNLYRGNGVPVRWNNERDRLVDSAQTDTGSLLLMGGDPALRGQEAGVLRIDTRSARRTRVAAGLYGAMRFWADRDGQVRVVLRRDGAQLQLLHRADADSDWQPLQAWPSTQPATWFPLGFGDEPQAFFVRSEDRVLRLDLQQPAQPPALVAQAPLLRQVQRLLRDGSRVVGASGPAGELVWDPALRAQQARWAAALRADHPSLRQVQGGQVLIAASVTDGPSQYWLGHRDADALTPLASSRPALQALAATERQRVALPGGGQVLLRRQAGAVAPGPLVWCLDCTLEAADAGPGGFNPLQAFLMSRGYVLALPSLGPGLNPGEDGLLPWAAQVLPRHRDALRALRGHAWVADQPVSLIGRDTGAYLAARLARELGPAAGALVVVGGLSELADHIARVDSPAFTDASRKAMRRLLGDADTAALRDGSPVQWAAALPARLLVVHGERNGLVHPDQGRALVAARRAAGLPVQWLGLPGATHELSDGPSRQQAMEAIEALLDGRDGR